MADAAPYPGTQFSEAPCTLARERRDYTEWRRGRSAYSVWVIDVLDDAITARLEAAAQHLGEARLDTLPGRAAHVTVFVCGFEVDVAVLDDDYGRAAADAQVSALAHAAIAPFTLYVGGLDSFDSAAFLRVADPEGGLAALRDVLASAAPEQRYAPYVPHLTLGLYRRAEPKAHLAARITAFDDTAPLALPVRALRRVRYDARTIDSPLVTTFAFSLQGAGRLR